MEPDSPDESSDQLTERADFREFVGRLEDVIVWSGDSSGFEYMSPAFEEVWGRSVEDVLADMSVIIEGVHPEDRDRVVATMNDNDDRLAAGESVEAQHRVVRPDGDVRWVEARVFPVHDASGALSEVIGVTIDITDRKRSQLELERQNERLDRFARVVSHDLRNPLATARGYLGLVEEDVDHPHLGRIDRALVRMDELVTDVLTLARSGGEIETDEALDLEAVARTAWSMAGDEGSELRVEDGLGAVVGDAGHVRQLLENLFRNSVEHGSTSNRTAKQSGDITERRSVSSQNASRSDDSVEHGSTGSRPRAGDSAELRSASSRTESDDSVEHGEPHITVRVGPLDGDGSGFYIADDGPGIPAADRERVFEDGYSSARDGSGLGLSIVREVATAHDWTVRLVDSNDGGARFEITGVDRVESDGSRSH